jgi:predicted MPP superfamily phosphohydrolase
MPVVTLAAIAAGVAGAWSALVAPYRLRLTHVDAPVAGLPAPLDGYRIAVLADLHHWPWIARGHVARAVRIANDAAPDLTVLLGDFSVSFQHSFSDLSAWLYDRALVQLTPPLRALRARDGVLAVLGNHDHYAGVERTVAWLPTIGARLLRNSGTVVERDGALLVVGGVDDWFEGTVDPWGGCRGLPEDAPTIVLSHVPDGVLALDAQRRVDLVLAGHTHGGQVVLPGYGAPVTMSRVATRANPAGWVPNARAPLFVSRGVGVQTPGRVFAPPEVVIVRLVRGAPGVAGVTGAVGS